MKKTLIFGTMIIGLSLLSCKQNTNPEPTTNPTTSVDTTKYTDVVITNRSELDSVQVYVTLPAGETIVGKFGMDSTNYNPNSLDKKGKPVHWKGVFWAKKGLDYHWGDTTSGKGGVVVCFGVDNSACTSQQNLGYKYGTNIFEFYVNSWYQNGIVTGHNESTDISCVDGLHSYLGLSVTSQGPRTVKQSINFNSFWDFGVNDSTNNLIHFTSSTNGGTFDKCVNIPGVFPYGCDWGYRSYNPPTPCENPPYTVKKCSDKWGNINTSQLNRPGQGGRITCTFYGFTKDPQPALK